MLTGVLLIAIALIISLAACGSQEQSGTNVNLNTHEQNITPLTPAPEFIPDYIRIRGREISTSLTELELLFDLIDEDIAPLKYMVNLSTLRITSTEISDLTSLAGLTNLTELGLGNNPNLSDLSPLAGLTNLTRLEFSTTEQPIDIAPLAGLTNLRELWLRGDGISDLTPLVNLTNLTKLSILSSPVSDLTPLNGLTNLEILRLYNNRINNLMPLTGLTKLIELDLRQNQISDITPLSGLVNLRELWLSQNQISNLPSLLELPNLRELYLTENNISDLTPLANLTNLTILALSVNQVSDVTPLSGLRHLTELVVFDNLIADWSPVKHVRTIRGRTDQRRSDHALLTDFYRYYGDGRFSEYHAFKFSNPILGEFAYRLPGGGLMFGGTYDINGEAITLTHQNSYFGTIIIINPKTIEFEGRLYKRR